MRRKWTGMRLLRSHDRAWGLDGVALIDQNRLGAHLTARLMAGNLEQSEGVPISSHAMPSLHHVHMSTAIALECARHDTLPSIAVAPCIAPCAATHHLSPAHRAQPDSRGL
jgi:hypothetical protein